MNTEELDQRINQENEKEEEQKMSKPKAELTDQELIEAFDSKGSGLYARLTAKEKLRLIDLVEQRQRQTQKEE